jgi:4-hydroxy-tetrahydrodipicolinate reductase
MIRLVIAGAAGRMGAAIARESGSVEDIEIRGALEHADSEAVGRDIGQLAGCGEMSVLVSADTAGLDFDVMVDFSSPNAVQEHLEMCRQHNAAIVIGTTGLNAQQNQKISEAAAEIPVLFAANTSVGVNLCVALVDMAGRVLGPETDIEIVEAHHRHKVDAPSGTALLLGEAAAASRDLDFPDCGVFSREGHTGERPAGKIGFSTIRGGDIAGEHTVMFIGNGERIEITHRATDRRIFAQGALRGVHWITGQQKGLYSMQDVLDLR